MGDLATAGVEGLGGLFGSTAANRVDSSRPLCAARDLSRKNVHQIEASRARDKYNYHV